MLLCSFFKTRQKLYKSRCKVAWKILSISLFQMLRFHFNFSILKLIMCSQFVWDICKYLLNAKILLNTTLKHREEKKEKKTNIRKCGSSRNDSLAICILQRFFKFIINIHRWRFKSRNRISVFLDADNSEQAHSAVSISLPHFTFKNILCLSLSTYCIIKTLEKILTIQKIAR